jgi:hypothetical protein
VDWIKKHPLSRLPLLPGDSESIGPQAVKDIEVKKKNTYKKEE